MGGLCGEQQQTEHQLENKLVLYGADFRGFIQPLRYALFLSKIPYTEIKFTKIKDFRTKFASREFPLTSLLPLMEYGSFKLCYALPIISCILKVSNRAGMLGESTKDCAQINDVMRTVYDLMWRVKDLNLSSKIKQKELDFLNDNLPLYTSLLSSCSGKFLGGRAKLTAADLFFFQLTYWVLGIFRDSPRLTKELIDNSHGYQQRFRKNQMIRPYIDSVNFMQRPFFCPESYWVHSSIDPYVKQIPE